MAAIVPVWVDGLFFGSVCIISRLDSGDFWVGSRGFGWFRVVSGGFGVFGWFRVVSGFINVIAPGQALPRVHMMICCLGASSRSSDHYEII